jgi:hypothetical protein
MDAFMSAFAALLLSLLDAPLRLSRSVKGVISHSHVFVLFQEISTA